MKKILAAFVLVVLLATGLAFSQTTVSLSPVAEQQFFDSNGTPLAGGELYTYISGTTTPLATYTDSTGTTQNTNPIVLDSSGRASIWLQVGDIYRFTLKDSSGNLIWQRDGVTSVSLSNGGTMAGTFTGDPTFSGNPAFSGNPSFTGSPTVPGNSTSGQMDLSLVTSREYDAIAYGADPSGTNDSSTAFMAAYNAMPSCHFSTATFNHCGTIVAPAGTYKLASGLHFTSPYVKIVGQGVGKTVFQWDGSSGCAFEIDSTDTTGNSSSVEQPAGGLFGFSLVGNSSAGVCGVETTDAGGIQLQHLNINSFTGTNAIGWWDNSTWNTTTRQASNERYNVYVTLANNTTNWSITDNGTNSPNDTFGYGTFLVYINLYAGQTGVLMNGGMFSYSNFHLIINSASSTGTVGLSLTNSGKMVSNIYDIHMEGVGTNFSIPSGTLFQGTGTIDTNSTAFGTVAPGTMEFVGRYYEATPGLAARDAIVGGLGDCGTSRQRFNVCTKAGLGPISFSSGGTSILDLDTNGNWRLPQDNGANLLSAGTITLSSGSGSHGFGHVYSTAPVCAASDDTNSANAFVKTVSASAISISRGKGSDVISFVCTPAEN